MLSSSSSSSSLDHSLVVSITILQSDMEDVRLWSLCLRVAMSQM